MKAVDYTFAVAKVRAVETGLLTTQDIEQLISAADFDNAVRFLQDKGFLNEKSTDISEAVKREMQNVFQLVREISPDKEVLDFLLVKNDFHNLKASLKALMANERAEDYFITLATVDPETIREAVQNKRFSQLPEFLRATAEKTYEVLVRTMDGQLVDILLDKSALDEMNLRAKKTQNNFILRLAELITVTANIKTAYRAAKTGKNEQFLSEALSVTKELDKTQLAGAAKKGIDELLGFLSGTGYKEAADRIKISPSAFEKWCDDTIIFHIDSAKYKSFGPEPLIAYYLAKEAEMKTIRIVMSCKHNLLPVEVIRERVRKLYV